MKMTPGEWRLLLRLMLAQRLELNAIEGALVASGALTEAHLRDRWGNYCDVRQAQRGSTAGLPGQYSRRRKDGRGLDRVDADSRVLPGVVSLQSAETVDWLLPRR
jgi:hypothetical protein